MKTETLLKITIASLLVAPSCAREYGIVIERQDYPEEKALYVNLIQKDKTKQKPLNIPWDGMCDADRKLFFSDSTYMTPFIYVAPGDTISFYNPKRCKYLNVVRNKNSVYSINGIRERKIAKWINTPAEKQR